MSKTSLILIGLLVIIFLIAGFTPIFAQNVKLENPLTGSAEKSKPLSELFGGFIKYFVLSFLGAFSLAMFVLGGFYLLASGGKPEMIKKGKDTLTWAVLGVALILSSYVILKLIIETLTRQ